MSEYMAPIVDWLLAVIEADTPKVLAAAGLEAFAEYARSWTWSPVNWPPVAVLGRNSQFDSEQPWHQKHELSVKFGVNGADPDEVVVNACKYMQILSDAIDASTSWPVGVTRVFVAQHDYGPLFNKDGSWAKSPEIHLEVERWVVQ